MKILLIVLTILFLFSCRKENRNEKKLDGIWNLEHIESFTYVKNEIASQSDTIISGVMNLEKTKGIYNDVTFSDWSPFQYFQLNWNTSARKLRVITFHTDGTPGASLFNFSFNIEKHTFRKLVLVSYQSDNLFNLTAKTVYYFKK